MITSFDILQELFKEIDAKLDLRVKIYMIGGAALMFSKLKSFTKDIDIIVKTKSEYDVFIKSIKKIGFKDIAITGGAYMLNLSTAQERGDSRIDLFLEKVCGKMHLSNDMVLRAKDIFKGSKLEVFVCANEDVFLFKTITLREGDIQDCEELIKRGLDWKVISKEMDYQVSAGEQKWITHINERLLDLESRGFVIPILLEVEKQTEKYYESLENLKK